MAARSLRYESYRNSQKNRRPRQSRHPERDQKNPAHPRGRPVADNIEELAKILLRYVGFSQKDGLGLVHIDGEKLIHRVYPQGV